MSAANRPPTTNFFARVPTQLAFFVAIIMALVFSYALSYDSSRLQEISANREAMQERVNEAEEKQEALKATLAYWQSNESVQDYLRNEQNQKREGEVTFNTVKIEGTPVPQEIVIPQDVAELVRPWQLWWYLLLDRPPPNP